MSEYLMHPESFYSSFDEGKENLKKGVCKMRADTVDLMLMQACINSYHVDGKYGEEKPVLENLDIYEEGHVQMEIGEYNGYIVVIYPGSHQFKDWLDNLTFEKMEVYSHGGNATGIKLHKGFMRQYSRIRDCLFTGLHEKRVDRKLGIMFGGHSLGGALATLSTYFISNSTPYRIERCDTFGSPRVGNGLFRKSYISSTASVKSKRFVNGADTVPKVPFALPTLKTRANWASYWMDYRHVGELMEIGQELTLAEILLYVPREIFGNMMDHYPDRYMINLRKEVNRRAAIDAMRNVS